MKVLISTVLRKVTQHTDKQTNKQTNKQTPGKHNLVNGEETGCLSEPYRHVNLLFTLYFRG